MESKKIKINLIDIGSVGGIEEPWDIRYVNNLIQFEPNQSSVVKKNYWKFPYAISNENKTQRFYVYGKNGTGSSLKKQNINWFKKYHNLVSNFGDKKLNQSWLARAELKESFDVKCVRLDDFLNNHKKNFKNINFEFMKSDTQGSEWDILQGAKDFLSNECLGLELELFKYPLYENIKLESEVKEFLFDYGYRIAGWTGYRNSLLASSDYLFLKAKDLDKEQKKVIDYIEKIYSPKGSERIIKKLSWINRCKRGLKKIRNKN